MDHSANNYRNSSFNITNSSSNINPQLSYLDSLSFLDHTPSSVSPQHALLPSHTSPAAKLSAAAPKNSKKRPRASRRAPTTVLTTDTSNFRAMVQEFTGIPAPPFSSTSFSRPRFDLFSSSAASRFRPTNYHHQLQGLSLQALLQPQSQFAAGSSNANSTSGMLVDNNNNSLMMMMPPSTSSSSSAGVVPGLMGSGWEQNIAQMRQGRINDKAAEVRGESMVESWICSSD